MSCGYLAGRGKEQIEPRPNHILELHPDLQLTNRQSSLSVALVIGQVHRL